jgi:hypothetical protein
MRLPEWYGSKEVFMTATPLCRKCAFAGLVQLATVVLLVPLLSAQQPEMPFTLDAALVYARQHSPRLSAKSQGVTSEQAAIAAARAERLPRLTLGAAARVSSQPTQIASAFYDATVELGVAQNVTAFTESDFNRTFQPASGDGSDHARGGHHVVLGGAVQGGRIFGAFPTFELGGLVVRRTHHRAAHDISEPAELQIAKPGLPGVV